MKNDKINKPVIIPIASGKGGVGKSLFTAYLAMSLADLGYKTIAVDLDLGGSNLHSYLGLANEHAGIGDFLLKKGGDLEQFSVHTSSPNLSFIAGDGLSPFLANLGYAQKIRLVKALRKLPAEFVIMDLGAGSTFNTLDFFNMSTGGIVITTPEYSSIMNLMVFLKNFVLRSIAQEVSRENKLKRVVDNARRQAVSEQSKTVATLIEDIGQICPESAVRVTNRVSGIRPRLAVNMIREPEDLDFLFAVKDSLQKRLSLNVDYIGSIIEDSSIQASREWRRPSSPIPKDGLVAKEVSHVARRLIAGVEDLKEQNFEQVLSHCKGRFGQTI